MTSFQALVLGLIQGLTEFLPVSSSAHLSLAPWLFGWQDPGLAFDVALHFGTLVAVIWYFRAEWGKLISAAISMIRNRRVQTVEEKRVLFLILATIPGAIGGLLLEKKAETAFRTPALTATALIIMGIVLWAADRFSRMDRELPAMRWLDALLIGCAQVIALIPGVSRSGSTISTGRLLGFDRQSAAVFSFLMSMPIIAAAVVLEGPEVLRTTGFSAPLIIGVLSAAISSWLAITILLRYVSRHSYGIFALYRVLLGIVVLVILYTRG
ncbi:MAG TPA: undecaprenyl-diphosphatase UppP [Gemmatimonadaceae bacterium]|jgi:undecaprenyl-diphosphatase|nr:undecaprenyl-diphosphatase UppP [Gemmatimonadaceae bacterium]